jgi:hypothetical protein
MADAPDLSRAARPWRESGRVHEQEGRRMRTKPLLASVLLAIGGPSSAFAEERLPADWEQKVLAVVQEPARARKISDLGRLSEVRREQSLAAMKIAREKERAVFAAQASEAVDRRISIQEFRDNRRKAVFLSFDPLFEVNALVTPKEWKEIWPKGFFAFPKPVPTVAGKILETLPSLVRDPGRQKRAMEVAASLVKAADANQSSRKKETGRLEKHLADGGIKRGELIDAVNALEDAQAKTDDAFVNGSSQLQQILTPEEWAALMRSLTPTAP